MASVDSVSTFPATALLSSTHPAAVVVPVSPNVSAPSVCDASRCTAASAVKSTVEKFAVAPAPSATVRHEVKDLNLAVKGKKRILWADHDMPLLAQIR